ncbi:MAG TPA: ASCH domain-containing protein [bacterium]|nr:ASCH domain-containing protein [bacterium]
MKALSVKQPWANKIASGEKTIEVRTWYTHYRGPLLIVSSVNPPIAPAGYALAVADLVDIRPMRKRDEKMALCESFDGAYSWVLENIRPIKPFPVRGQKGIYEVKYNGK